MKPAILALLGEVDSLQPPIAGSADAKRYKEWHHFNIETGPAGWHIILNLGLAGDPHDPACGRATVILLAYRPETGWCGSADSYGVEEVEARSGAIDLAIGASTIRYDGTRYDVQAVLKDGTSRIAARLEPVTFPLPIRNRVPFGGGTNDWIVVPRLVANGELEIGGLVIPLADALAYHDHNRGYWYWQDDLGWDWGFVLDPRIGADRYSIVFERVTDRQHRQIGEGALVIWRGHRIFKVFLSHNLLVRYRGLRNDLAVPRLPPILNLVRGAPRPALPGQIQIEAREQEDWVTIRFGVEAALQLALPHETSDRHTILHELWGPYHVEGEVKGRSLRFAAPGFAEWAES